MTFGEKLQRLRKANGLSQEQLAEKLNVSRQAISKWETGAIPDMDNVIKIGRYFDCSLDYLMNNETEDHVLKEVPHGIVDGKGKNPKISLRIAGLISGLGATGLLILGILSSVFPAIVYDPPQGEVRAIIATGFKAFLMLHNLTWLFVLCGVALLGGLCVWLVCRHKS